MKALIKMIDAKDRVVASKELDVSDEISEMGLAIVMDAQNQVFQDMGFQGRCTIELVKSSK